MNRSSKTIFFLAVGVKLVVLIGVGIGLSYRVQDQVVFLTSEFPEHEILAKENSSVVSKVLLFVAPLVLSLIVDLDEKRRRGKQLSRRWLVLTGSLIASYLLIAQQRGHWITFFVAGLMILGLIMAISLPRLARMGRTSDRGSAEPTEDGARV
ncbi:MAG: hypothetical protein IPI55_08745 [Flavobacteriales bacterium]|nr:hypothetical protein [Flavobacteriales bacterium]